MNNQSEPVEVNVTIWSPTAMLRWRRQETSDGKRSISERVLSQLWVEKGTANVQWRDVPLEENTVT